MTKADETTETDFWAKDEEYERDITNWLVVAYDENADLAGYISGKDGTWTPDISNEDSRTTVEMKLPFGTYHFYAFANLQSLEDGTSLYQKITEAHSLAELSEVKILDSGTSIDTRNEEKKGKFGGEEASRKRIPMSSYAQKHTVLPAPAENKFEIPLIRMIGKVQVEITNNLDKSITVNQLDIMNLRKGSLPIWLLPWGNENYLEFKDNKDLEEPLAPSFPKDANSPVVSLEDLYTESIKPGDNEKEIQAKPVDGENGSKRAYIRYIPETNAAVGENGGGIHLGHQHLPAGSAGGGVCVAVRRQGGKADGWRCAGIGQHRKAAGLHQHIVPSDRMGNSHKLARCRLFDGVVAAHYHQVPRLHLAVGLHGDVPAVIPLQTNVLHSIHPF